MVGKMSATMTDSEKVLKEQFEAAGQGQVFGFWDKLDRNERTRLCEDTRSIDLAEMKNLVETLVCGAGGEGLSLKGLEPAPYIKHPQNGGNENAWTEAREIGEAALRGGKVCAVIQSL